MLSGGGSSEQPGSECPHCKSTNTVRIGQAVGKWMHFCFACGKRFELKIGSEREAST